jgi:cold shock CspA family protein
MFYNARDGYGFIRRDEGGGWHSNVHFVESALDERGQWLLERGGQRLRGCRVVFDLKQMLGGRLTGCRVSPVGL